MRNTFSYVPPIENNRRKSFSKNEVYEKSLDLYNEDKYLESFHCLLDYISEGFRTKFGNEDGTQFDIPHGSIIVHIRVKENFLYFEMDFLSIPKDGNIAMLRQIADLNNRLSLASFIKEGDKLKMHYKTPLGQSHPHKIYNLLQDMCYFGDRYDDEFCTKFNAVRSYEPKIESYSATQIDQIYQSIQYLGNATLEGIDKYKSTKNYDSAIRLLLTTFYQINYFANPQGQIFNDIKKSIEDIFDEDTPYEEQLSKGVQCLKKLLNTSKEQLSNDLYFAEKLFSFRKSAPLRELQEFFEEPYDGLVKTLQSEEFERATLFMLYKIYKAYYNYDIPEDVDRLFSSVLEKSAEKPFEEAAPILIKAIKCIIEGEVGNPDFLESGNSNSFGSVISKILNVVKSIPNLFRG